MGRRARASIPVGTRIHGKVTSVADFGVFVEIEEGIEGLVYASEVGKNVEITAAW